jgi:hypothetical protein
MSYVFGKIIDTTKVISSLRQARNLQRDLHIVTTPASSAAVRSLHCLHINLDVNVLFSEKCGQIAGS